MMKRIWLAAVVVLRLAIGTLAADLPETSPYGPQPVNTGSAGNSAEPGAFVVVSCHNPAYCPNELFPAFEEYHHPRIAELRARYKLDEVVKGERDEWQRILLLRHWIHTNIRIDNEHPTPAKPDAFAILDAALKGGGFHCTHFSIVQHAVLNSYGYVTRRLGCGPGTKENGVHHGVNEVWVNPFCKWVLIDAKYDLHFEKDGVPLAALQIRDEVWADGGKSVQPCFGLDGKGPRDRFKDTEVKPETYRWCSWETSTNWFTHSPSARSSTLIMYEDENFRGHTWYRDGKPHWAYKTPYLVITRNRSWIEWTPGVISSKVTLVGDKATVTLTSFTPNIRSYQVKIGRADWADCEERAELPLQKEFNRFAFRAVNLFGVAGPEHEIRIEWRPGEQPKRPVPTAVRRLPLGEYRDRMTAGRIGQMVGVTWGGPGTSRYRGRMMPAEDVPRWEPDEPERRSFALCGEDDLAGASQ